MRNEHETEREALVEQVRDRYRKIAEGSLSSCCGVGNGRPSSEVNSTIAHRIGYDAEELGSVPEAANLGVGCGAPIAHLDLRPGEVVLDLGSGGGLDALLAAERVGPDGRVIGVDMTAEMIDRARGAAARAGATQVEFRLGRLESLPVDDASVDAVTSNCVINLVPDKRRVFSEVARVLRPGGRLVISDIVLDAELPVAVRHDLLAYVGCVAGASLRGNYFETVRSAGLDEVDLLADIDYLGSIGDTLPDDIRSAAERSGVDIQAMRGSVRSVTFRARRPR